MGETQTPTLPNRILLLFSCVRIRVSFLLLLTYMSANQGVTLGAKTR
jgi:hypothetical protein